MNGTWCTYTVSISFSTVCQKNRPDFFFLFHKVESDVLIPSAYYAGVGVEAIMSICLLFFASKFCFKFVCLDIGQFTTLCCCRPKVKAYLWCFYIAV